MAIRQIILSALLLLFVGQAQAQPCNTKLRPLVLIHGFLGAGDNYSPLLHQLQRGGYCAQRSFVFNWNTLSRSNTTEALDKLIDSVRQLTGSTQVDIMGHSAGGGVAYTYLADSARQKKVARYVHIGSTAAKAPPGVAGPVPTLNVYSKGDFVVRGADIPGATNLQFTTLDHFEVVTSDSTAAGVFTFLTGEKQMPRTKIKAANRPFEASGKLLSLGENIPQAGAKVVLMPVEQGRLGAAVYETLTDAQGNYTLKGVKPQQPYAIFAYPLQGRPIVHFVPQVQPGEQLLYLRTLPATGMVSLLLNGLPKDSSQVVLVGYSSRRAIQHGRDTLAVQGNVLSTSALADPSRTAIAWFLYDANKNGATEMNQIALFATAPFMRGIDMHLPAGSTPLEVHHNGRSYLWPAIPASEAVCIAVLQ